MTSIEGSEFFENPSEQILNLLTKDQLIEVATHYGISLSTNDKKLKENIRIVVKTALTNQQIMLSVPESVDLPVTVPSSVALSFEQQKE